MTAQDVSYPSADGTAVYGCLRKPLGKGPFSAIVFIHGGLGDTREFVRDLLKWGIADSLLQENYVLLSTDYRNVFLSPDFGYRESSSGKDVEDVVAAFKYLSELPFVDGDKIAYFGDSHGSYLALMAAIRTNPRAVVHNWGVASLGKWYDHIKESINPFYRQLAVSLEKAFGGTPDQIPQAYEQVSATAHVHKIRCPVLINHGENDEFVPVAHAYELAEALDKAKCEYVLKIYKNATHGLHKPQATTEMKAATLAFLKKHLQ